MKKQIFCIMALAVAMTAKATVVITVNTVEGLKDIAKNVTKIHAATYSIRRTAFSGTQPYVSLNTT